MHVLFWTPPWPVHGDPQFFRNAFIKHLCRQANTLVGFAEKITVVTPAHFAEVSTVLDHTIELISLPLSASRVPDFGDAALYQSLYKESAGAVTDHLVKQVEPYLPANVDIILQWENPVPFLRVIYPHALIINQMPGAFSRPPYPHTVTFDPVGLYRDGCLHQYGKEIQIGTHLKPETIQFGRDFVEKTKSEMDCFQGVTEFLNGALQPFNKVALLPLQASKHYSFSADSGFHNQLDMMWSVLERTDLSTGVIVTQYRNGLVADTPLDQTVAAQFRASFPNLIYDERLEDIDSVSQFLLPKVDAVISASSSLAMQGMVWQKELDVVGQTFLETYATSYSPLRDVPWAQRCENTLATLISRHQPLASSVTEDGAFLMGLLTEMRARHVAGKEGLALLPEFSDIDPAYSEKLLGEYRIERTARALSMSVRPDRAAEQLVQFKKLVDDPNTTAISFDVFDTLICRSVEKPADLYRFLDTEALELTDGVAVNFGKTRALCEVETRSRYKGVKEEITLADIYDTLAQYYGVPVGALSKLQMAENTLEVMHSRVRSFGKALFDLARAQGKSIYLISDMYLPHETITRMLEKAGYADRYQALYLSCDYNSTKHSGALYEIFLKDTGIAPAALVHVGDNKLTDIQMANAHGIRAFRWSSAIEWMRSNPVYKATYAPRVGAGEKARSAVAGTTAQGLFDAPVPKNHLVSLSGGDPFRLGYAVLGPMITGYMQWLGREAQRDGTSDLFFMAREGWVLKEVFDQLHPSGEGIPKTHYLLGSRRAVRVAACVTSADVLALLGMPYDPGIPLSALIEGRFGFSLGLDHMPRLQALGVKKSDLTLDRSFTHRQLLCAVVQEFMDEILEHAAAERETYLAFLEEQGFGAAVRPGIVDVGWKANIQGALGNLTGRRTVGYYYATIQDSEIWMQAGDTHRAYIGTAISDALSPSTAVRNRHLVEFMLCHSTRSLVAISQIEERLQPVYRKESDLEKRRRLIDAMHRGAIAYARTFKEGFTPLLNQIYIDPNLAEAALSSLVNTPKKLDAELFIGHSFEDAVGGLPQKFVIAPSDKAPLSQSVWRAGFEMVHTTRQAAPKKRSISSVSPKSTGPKLETFIIKRFVNKNLSAKYDRDCTAFFVDSQRQLIQLYWRVMGHRFIEKGSPR